MMDTTSFNYTINEFDPKGKVVDVTFGDGTWARIQLTDPLPTSMNALDEIVRQYTKPVEAAKAQDSEVDLSFITAATGQQRAAARFSVKEALDGNPQPVTFPLKPKTLDDWRQFMRAQVAAQRYQKETAGVTLPNGEVAPTDRDSQAKMTAKSVAIGMGLVSGTFSWKMADGTSPQLTIPQFQAMAAQAAAAVQAAYDWESLKLQQIKSAASIPEVQAVLP